MSLLEGLNGEETQEKIKNNYWPILFVNWQASFYLFGLLFSSSRADVGEGTCRFGRSFN